MREMFIKLRVKGKTMEDEFENMDQDYVETDAETIDDSSDDVVSVPGIVFLGIGALGGIVIDRVVIPAAVNAFNGVVNFISTQLNKNDYVEIENGDSPEESKN